MNDLWDREQSKITQHCTPEMFAASFRKFSELAYSACTADNTDNLILNIGHSKCAGISK